MIRRLASAAAVSVLLLSTLPASSTTLLDTTNGVSCCLGGGDLVGTTDDQSLGVSFQSVSAVTITDVVAYITLYQSTSASINIGIMADNSGVPTGTFLFDTVSSLSGTNAVTLSSLDWLIAAGTYWLVATPDTNEGIWTTSTTYTGVFAFANPSSGGQWVDTTDELPMAIVSSTPLPGALPLCASGLGAIGWLLARRKRKNAAAVAAA
jgi:hypothetical protein